MSDPPLGPPRTFVRAALVVEGGLGLLAVALGWLIGRWPWSEIDWNLSALAIGSLASLPMFVALALMLRSRAGWCVQLRRVVDEQIVPLFAGCGAGELAAISILAGFGEELLFRGLIQGTIGEFASPAVALGLASLLFGLFHPLTISYAVITTLAGLYLGSLWLWSGNLLAPIVAHALYDFVALVYLLRRPQAAAPGQSV